MKCSHISDAFVDFIILGFFFHFVRFVSPGGLIAPESIHAWILHGHQALS